MSLVCTGQLLAPDAAALARLLVLAPLLEEWIVRAGLQEWLLRREDRRPPGARRGLLPVAVSSLAFACLHLGAGWRAALLVLPPGVALALLYRWRRDWRLCALAHGAMNAMAVGGCAWFTQGGVP